MGRPPCTGRSTAAIPGSATPTACRQEHAHIGVLREAMAVDPLTPAGVYFGTSTGSLFGSSDEGVSWRRIADDLPAIWSVETAVVD